LPVGVADFNGDHKADVFWWNQNTGQTSAWLMNGTNTPVYATYGIMSPSTWSLVGFGDVDGDGKADVFWWNTTTGQTLAWLMNGASMPKTQAYASIKPDQLWIPYGLGDFDGNGKADVFWWNTGNGQTSAWLMNGTNTPTYVTYYNVPDSSGWFPVGIGDFDKNGKADLLWMNCNSSTTCATSVWLMK